MYRELGKLVVEVIRVNARMMVIELVIKGFTLKMISAYTLNMRLNEEDKRRFSKELGRVI